MFKKYSLISILLVFAISYSGCTSTASLLKTQTTNVYVDKVDTKVALYIHPDFYDRVFTAKSNSHCWLWKAEVSMSNAYVSAIQSGIESAFKDVVLLKTIPTPDYMNSNNIKLAIVANLSNEGGDVTYEDGFFSGDLKSNFQTSINLSFSDKNGRAFYTFTANGASFNSLSGSCGDMADCLKKSMEIALRQASDYIAQSCYSASQIRDAIK